MEEAEAEVKGKDSESFMTTISKYDTTFYKMNHKNRGKALIINMKVFKGDTLHYKTRFGSLKDVKRLEEVLKNKLRFETQILNSPKKNEIFAALDAS